MRNTQLADMSRALWHEASADVRAMCRKKGFMLAYWKELVKTTGIPMFRQQVEAWFVEDADKRIEPRYGIATILLGVARKLNETYVPTTKPTTEPTDTAAQS